LAWTKTRRARLCQFYPDFARSANETVRVIRLNEKNNQAEFLKLAGKTAEQAATEYWARFESAGAPIANQAVARQSESEAKRIFGLRADYLIAAIIFGILICIASLFLFPDWGLSIRALVILFPLAFVGVTNFVANFRRAFERLQFESFALPASAAF
jgi:hypothetical protein